MFCQKCGATLPTGVAFCPTCGAKVESASASAVSKPAGDTLKKEKGFDFKLTRQKIVTLVGVIIALITCFLPYLKRYEAGMIALNKNTWHPGDIGTRTLMQEGGIAIFALAIAVGILVFKKSRLAYRIVAVITIMMTFILSVSPEISEGRKYVYTESLIGAQIIMVAGFVLIAGLIMDFANSRKKEV